MCLPLIFFVLQVLALKRVTAYPYKDYVIAYIPIEEFNYLSSQRMAFPEPYYSNFQYADPRYFESMLQQEAWSYLPTPTGPLSFGGPVRAKGAVRILGEFGNQDYGTCTSSYSPNTAPVTITSQPTSPTVSTIATATTLPAITTLPVVRLPSLANLPIIVNKPTVCVPATPMPVAMATKTVSSLPVETNAIDSSYISVISEIDASVPVSNPVSFSGMVPASGRVKICATFS